MSVSRRQFITTGSFAVAALSLPRRVVEASEPNVTALLYEVMDFKAIADAALSAATDAGAAYADIHFRGARFEQIARLTPEEERRSEDRNPRYTLEVSFGVRALVNGYWGHAGFDGVITPAVAKGMGVDAVGQAKFAAKGKTRTVELAKTPVVNGTWQMPVEIDPFTVSYKEKYDFMVTVNDEVSRLLPGDRRGDMRSGRRSGLKEYWLRSRLLPPWQ